MQEHGEHRGGGGPGGSRKLYKTFSTGTSNMALLLARLDDIYASQRRLSTSLQRRELKSEKKSPRGSVAVCARRGLEERMDVVEVAVPRLLRTRRAMGVRSLWRARMLALSGDKDDAQSRLAAVALGLPLRRM